jgi:uncharacterized SAM-binding protein YcdF (DUF218 family)
MASNWIVVPDGLAAAAGRPLPEPSFVYRRVLDWTARHAAGGDRIYLAPANAFGGPVTEQEAGYRYLQPLTPVPITWAPTNERRYVNTRGNARLLRAHLEQAGGWPLPAVRLVAYSLHLPRALESFAQEGYSIEKADAVTLGHIDRADPATRIVRRLWYYRYPLIHHGYERLALAMTRYRVI